MDSERDWRGSFGQLAAARERNETAPAANEAAAELRAPEQPPAEAGLILAPPEIAPPVKPKRKRASTAKRARAPRKRAARKPPARKGTARKAGSKAAAKAMADSPAIPLPDLSTPLAEPAVPTQPLAPLPRKASLAPYRKGGLIEAIGFWLRTTARRARAKLGASTALAKSAGGVSEIDQLRAENEQLRIQLDALLALSDAAQFKFKS